MDPSQPSNKAQEPRIPRTRYAPNRPAERIFVMGLFRNAPKLPTIFTCTPCNVIPPSRAEGIAR